jgi:hypothetical protein
MKALKIYLMIMGGLLTIALLAGVVVWYLYQDLPGANPSTLVGELPTSESAPSPEPVGVSGEGSAPDAVPVYTITPESLTDSQRAVLETFGLGDSSFKVTEGMILCAKNAVGEVRFEEILNGSAPGPLESMSLLPCMKE